MYMVLANPTHTHTEQDSLEVRVVRDDVVPNLHDFRPSLLKGLLQEQGLKRSLQHIAHVL